jgi:hypothetical protein
MKTPLAVVLCALLTPAFASPSVENGHKLVEKAKCEQCHAAKVPGPEGAIYLRKDRRVGSWARLKAQVTGCNADLNLGLFPEEELDVAAFLNDRYYKFPVK